MTVQQIYQLVNTATSEALGESAVQTNEDLSNIIDVGVAVFNANAVDQYVKALVNQIGKVIVESRPYEGSLISILREGWEYGSVCEKIRIEMPSAVENDSWSLENNTSYDPFVTSLPEVSAKFYNSKTTFEVDMTFTTVQIKQSFQSATQMNAFVSAIETAIANTINIKTEEVVMRTLDCLIADTVKDDFGSNAITGGSHVKAVNLLYLYNQLVGASNALSVSEAMASKEFLRFAVMIMKKYAKRLTKMSVLFNVNGKQTFTPASALHTVLLEDFKSACEGYATLNEPINLPNAEGVAYWQGTGTSYAFDDVSKITVKTPNNTSGVTVTGVVGCMFDHEAIGVANTDRRTTSQYNGKAEYTNMFYKHDASYWIDENYNCVVFFLATA